MGLVLAEPGGGKSVLLNVLGDELRRPGRQVALVNLFGLTPQEFLWQLAAQWGLALDDDTPLGPLWRAISDHLVENRCQKIDTIVLLDDADEAATDVLDTVSRLALLEPSRDARLTIIVAARPGRVNKLGSRILELAELRVELEAWEPVDTQSYVESALKLGGRGRRRFRAGSRSPAARARAWRAAAREPTGRPGPARGRREKTAPRRCRHRGGSIGRAGRDPLTARLPSAFPPRIKPLRFPRAFCPTPDPRPLTPLPGVRDHS